jgi:hypothetical protein
MTSQPERSAGGSNVARSLAPTDAEIEAWAARERERRQRWLSGPTPEQAAVSVSRERERAKAELGRVHSTRGSDLNAAGLLQRSVRSAQLVAEGAVSLLLHVSLREVCKRLVQSGLDWENELFQEPRSGGRSHPSPRRSSAPPDPVAQNTARQYDARLAR